MIRAKDPRLRRISVAYEGFVVPQGIPLPRYSSLIEPLPVANLAVATISSPPVFQVEEEEEVEQEEEGFVDLPQPQTTTKSSINLFHHQTYLKTWTSRGNPSATFKSYWRAS